MHRIKFLETGDVFEVLNEPLYQNGFWECGDRRFYDPDRALYEKVPEPITRVAFKSLFTIQEQVSIKAARSYAGEEATPTQLKLLLDAAYDILDDPQLETLDLEAPIVTQFLGGLVVAGILTDERAAAIAAGVSV